MRRGPKGIVLFRGMPICRLAKSQARLSQESVPSRRSDQAHGCGRGFWFKSVGNVNYNAYIFEIVDRSAQRDDYWNVRVVGSDCLGCALQDSRFVFWPAVRQRRALVKAGVCTFLRRGDTVESFWIHRISGNASRNVVAEEASTKGRAEAPTAQDRAHGARSRLNNQLANGPPLGLELWSDMAEEARLALLEGVFAL